MTSKLNVTSKINVTSFVVTVLALLLLAPLLLGVVFAPESITGTQDDTLGVWLFSAGTSIPAGEPTDDIIERAIFYDLLEYIGDADVEVYEFGWGWIEPTTGQEDMTLAEVVTGLTEIDDFGFISNDDDDDSNFDTGRDGYFEGGFDPNQSLVIVADGIIADGVLGPSEATSAAEAEAAIEGYEIFIFEDAELSGMNVTLSNSLGLSISFLIGDLQVNPPTRFGADDTLIAIDLDSLVEFDGTFIDTIRIEDDGITSASTFGDTTLEIDAIATRSVERCVPYVPNPQRLWTTNSSGLAEIDEFLIGSPVYLKTADDFVGTPLIPGKYRIWLFNGNIIPVEGWLIPSDFGAPWGLTDFEVFTNSSGRFGPVKLWDIPVDPTLICHNFTVVLDQLEVGLGGEAKVAPNIGVWGVEDYRDDLCTRRPTPPSFHVIPEVALGTIMALVSMFGSLGFYVVRKKRQQRFT